MITGSLRKIIPLLVVLFVFSCNSKKETTDENFTEKPTISVVNYPLYYIAKTIGGEYVNVYFPVINGDPAYWKPEARQVINFQNSDLIFINGAGYAKWIEKVSLPSSKIVNTSLAFKNQWIETDEEVMHSHGADGKHSHKETAFTTWLNFKFTLLQAKSIHEALINILPDHVDEINQNFAQLKKDLIQLDLSAETICGTLGDQYIIASHPVYQYFESGYGINLVSTHWEPDEMPSEDQWKNLEKSINDRHVSIMLWEGSPLEEVQVRLDELNVKIVVFNPCANKPEEGDFMNNMNDNLKNLERAIEAL